MKLTLFLKSLSHEEKKFFAERCGTSVGYLKQVGYGNKNCGGGLAICIERESGGLVTCEEICPVGVDWQYIRNAGKKLSVNSAS